MLLHPLNFPSAAPAASLKKPPPPHPHLSNNHTFLPLSFHSTTTTTTTTTTKPKFTPLPNPPSPLILTPTHHHPIPSKQEEESEEEELDFDFHEKALYLDSIGIDSLGVLSRAPSVLASTSLPDLKTLASYLSSLGLSPSDLRRLTLICPSVLSLPLRRLTSVVSFLTREANLPHRLLPRALHRRPRLLLSPVSSRLRPTLYFLHSIGLHDVSRHTHLLSSSVELSLLPRLDFFLSLGLSRRASLSMFRRFPALFCYSISANFRPKLDYFVAHMGRPLRELTDFPQYFSFSLDKRIIPRHQMCLQKGVYFPLSVMLKSPHDYFARRLGYCLNTSLPVTDSPLWCATPTQEHNYDDDDDRNVVDAFELDDS